MSLTPISLKPKKRFKRRGWLLIGAAILVVVILGAVFAYQFVYSRGSQRWEKFSEYRQNPETLPEVTLYPGQRCGDAPFAFPTTGAIFGLWDQSYRFRHRHQGLDIFSGTEPGITPVYAVYPGYLTRSSDWVSTVIIRIPSDPLEPGRQIWTYYTHMADVDGNSFVGNDFPRGTQEVFVEAGTLLGYQGNYSGNPVNPTGLHLHFSIVKDDGDGRFLNELDINNTYDPTPYFNLPVNQKENQDEFPVCTDTITQEDWVLEPDNE